MVRWTLLLISALLLITSLTCADVISVSGDVSGVWSADTVLVTGEVSIPAGQSLVIQPGVEVLFQTAVKFIVNTGAQLHAVGTPTDSIRFDVLTYGSTWKGIRLTAASDSTRLEYCHVTHGLANGGGNDAKGGGIYCYNSSPIIINCLIDSCGATDVGGGLYCSNSRLVISGSTFRGNYTSATFGHGGAAYCLGSSPRFEGNLIEGNAGPGNYADAGGLYFCGCDAIIAGNLIRGNTAGPSAGGGGISMGFSPSSTIKGNLILENSAGTGGGIYLFDGANPAIYRNIIHENSVLTTGGGIYINTSLPEVHDNIFSGNIASYAGGGIYFDASRPEVSHNIIIRNSTQETYGRGGGINCYGGSDPILKNNLIEQNSSAYGGGISCYAGPNPTLNQNTILNNHASISGGAINCYAATPSFINTIIFSNFTTPIYQNPGSALQLNYSDVEYGWPGTGNISTYPAFVDTAYNDYRLRRGSPCIDAGDPNPVYNDPDGTRADMGAYYYDQSTPVQILLSPHEIPYLIPAGGGDFQYTLRVFNRDQAAHNVTVWCDVTLPDSAIHGPTLGPITLTIPAGILVTRVRTQHVPPQAPMGVYSCNAYAVVDGDTSRDSFMWGKLGQPGFGVGDWTNSGEELTGEGAQILTPNLPTRFALYPSFPNPFNPTTTIRFDLPQAAQVRLEVFDINGRIVGATHASPLPQGEQSIAIDGSGLAAGVYVYRLTAIPSGSGATPTMITGKMVLLK